MENVEYKLSAREIVHLLKKKWTILLAATLALAIVAPLCAKTSYEATATYQFRADESNLTAVYEAERGNAENDDFDPEWSVIGLSYQIKAAEKLTPTCAAIMTSSEVLQPIIDELNLETSVKQLADAIEVTNVSGTAFIEITVHGSRKEQVQQMSDKLVPQALERFGQLDSVEDVQCTTMPMAVEQGGTAREKKICAVFGAVIGFLASAGIILARRELDDKFHSRKDIRRELQLDTLGELPVNDKGTHMQELRARLRFCAEEKNARIVLFATVEDEPYTETVRELAYKMTAGDRKVLLMDCDLQGKNLSKEMKLAECEPGVGSFLQGNANLKDSVHVTEMPGVSILSADENLPDTAGAFTSKHMDGLANELKENYDYIFAVAPPMVNKADAIEIGRFADAVVLFLDTNHTSVKKAKQCKEQMDAVNVKIIGAILNNWDKNE